MSQRGGNSQSHRRSRAKGQVWEREVARILRKHGWQAKRGLQARDGSDAPDVCCDLPLWIECKAGRAPNVHEALAQAMAASGKVIGRTRLPPVAVVKADRREPIACMYLDDFLRLVDAAVRLANDAGEVKP